MEDENKNENEKKIKNEKHVTLMTWMVIGAVVIIFVSFVFAYYYKNYLAPNEGYPAMEIGEELNDYDGEIGDGGDYEYEETDIGYKVDPNKKYVYSVEKQVFEKDYDEYDYEDYYYASLELPVINIASKEIDDINKKMEEYYNKYKSAYQNTENLQEGEILPTLDYSYITYNNILFVNFNYGNDTDGYYNQLNYNIDIKNQKILSNREFLKMAGYSKEVFEELISDELYTSYLYDIGADSEFNEKYSDFDKFKNDVTFSKDNDETGRHEFKVDYDLICDMCDVYYINYGYNDETESYDDYRLMIHGLHVPSPFGTDGPDDYMTLDKEPKLLFTKSYYYPIDIDGSYMSGINNAPVLKPKFENSDKINNELGEFFEKGKEAIDKNGGTLVMKAVETDEEMELPDGSSVNTMDEVIFSSDGQHVIDEYFTIDYYAEIIDNKILSILVEKTNTKYSELYHGMWEYYVYNFDIETGKQLTNKEFIEKCGYTVDDFIQKMKYSYADFENISISPVDRDVLSQSMFKDSITKVDNAESFYVFEEHDLDKSNFEWRKVEMK